LETAPQNITNKHLPKSRVWVTQKLVKIQDHTTKLLERRVMLILSLLLSVLSITNTSQLPKNNKNTLRLLAQWLNRNRMSLL
jgi:hypothetical protein